MKIGIQQLSQLAAQAFDYQANLMFQNAFAQHDSDVNSESLYLQIHAEAEKSHAALRLMQRDIESPTGYVTHAEFTVESMTTEEKSSTLVAITQAKNEIDRIVQTYLPQKIAA